MLAQMQDQLTQTILTQLSTLKPIPRQVLDALMGQYELAEEAIPAFLVDTLPTLDDTELDLLLSPAFTPTLSDRQACIALLEDKALTPVDLQDLQTRCLAQKPQSRLQIPNGSIATFLVPDVSVLRVIRLLQLTLAIDAMAYQQIHALVPEANKSLYLTLARETAWTGREAMLNGFLPVVTQHQPHTMRQLTDFVRTYRPTSLEELDKQLESYIRSCESDLNRAGEMSFHDERLKEKYILHHEGNHDPHLEEHVRSNYLHMMDQGRALRDLLAQVKTHVVVG